MVIYDLNMIWWLTGFTNYLKTKAADRKADNPNWWQAINGPFVNEYWNGLWKEIETLEVMESR